MKKALKKIAFLLFSAVMVCCFFVGCGLSTKIKVTYMAGTAQYTVQEYDLNQQIALPLDPVVEGQKFMGWYTDSACTQPYAEGKITAGLTLYAKFEPAVVYIKVNTDGGQSIPLIEVQPGGEYELPEAVKEGYTFTGYYYYDEDGEKQDFPTSGVIAAGMSDMVVFASYTINKYTITLNDGFSAEPTTAEVEYNKLYTPSDANRPGYTFVAWHTVEENQTEETVYDATQPVKANVSLYAQYTANSYKITVANNTDTTTEVIDVTYDAAYALTEAAKTGWTFVNYTYNGEEFDAEGTYTYAQNIRITANYSKNAYAVTFKNTDGTVITTKNVEHGKTVSEPTKELTKTGYTYTLSADLSTPITAATEITVTYTANPYTITITNTVGAPTQTIDVVYNGTYTLTANAVTGYTFTGFTFNGEAFDADVTYTYTNNITLTAVYTKNVYDVVFKDAASGAAIKTVSVEHGNTVSAPAELTRTGYTYTLSADLSTPITAATEITVTYTAKTASVTVIGAQSGYVLPTITFGESFTLAAPTKLGHNFVKFTDSDGKEYLAGQPYTCDFENLILTAEFDGDEKVVTFMVDGAQTSQVTVLKDHTVARPATDPSKTGYTFKGWTLHGVAYDFAGLVTSDITLHAYFEAIPYTITITNNAGAPAQVVSVVYGGEYTLTANAIEGYTFSKFTYNDADFAANVTYTYTESIIVTAVYTKNVYAVTFVEAGTGNVLATVDVAHGDKVSAPNLAKDGHSYTLNKDLNAIITAPTTITVTYTANTYNIHLNLDGGTGTEDVSVTFGKPYDLTTLVPTKQGYIFDGYFAGETEWTTGTYNVAGNTTLKAKWVADYKTVTFSADGVETEVQVLNGSPVVRPADPTKTGHTFTGWTLNGVAYDFSTAVTSDIDLVAQFSRNTYTLTIDNVGGNGEESRDITYGAQYNLTAPTKLGNKFVKYVDESGNEFALSGKYDYTTSKKITAIWEATLEKVDDWFKENGGATFVYLTEKRYTFTNTTLTIKSFISGDATCVTISGDRNAVLEPHKPCEFIVSVTKYDTNGAVVNTYDRTMKIVEMVTQFTAGDSYRSAWVNRNAENFDNNEKNDKMLVGRVDYRPDVKVQKLVDQTMVDLPLADANIELEVLVDGIATMDYTLSGNSITFGEGLVGKTVSVTVAPRYAVYEGQTVSFSFVLNNGVNVYDNATFKAAYTDTSVREINVLRNIKMELDADQMHVATGAENYKDWDGIYRYTVPAGTVAPRNESGGTAVYDRLSGNLTVNGNYFTADGSKIPLVDNRLDNWCFGSAGNDFILENVQFSLFKFGIDDRSKATNDLLQMNNLYVLGNMGEATNWGAADGETYKVNKDGKDYNMLTMSGAAIGIQARYANISLDNVTIRRAVLGLNAYATKHRTTVNPVGESLHGQTGSLHGTTIYAKDCIIEECWANDTYMWGFGLMTLDSSRMGICSGAAMHVDSLPTDSKDYTVNSKMIFKNGTTVENLLSGGETWFKAYTMDGIAKDMKSAVNGGVVQATGAMVQYSMLTNNYKAITMNDSLEMMNFALLVKAGSGNTTEWSNNDKDGKPTVEVVGLRYLDTTDMSTGLPGLVGAEKDEDEKNVVPEIDYVKFDASSIPGFTGANHMEGYLGLYPAA